MIVDKLVRNKIPQQIEAEGGTVKTKVVNDVELQFYLKEKLLEEVNELICAKTKDEIIEEMADVYEVLMEYKEAYGIDPKKVGTKQMWKYTKKGDFSEHIVLLTCTKKKRNATLKK